MKLFWTLLILSIIVVIYSKIKIIISKIHFSVNLKSLNIASLSISDLLKLDSTTDLQTELQIINDNKFSITFSNLKVWLYYKNCLIAQSIPMQGDDIKKYIMPNSKNSFNEIIRLQLTRSTLDLISAMKSNDVNNSNVDYVVSINIFGFPIKFKGTYNTLQ